MAFLVGVGPVMENLFGNIGNIGNATQALENMFGPYRTISQIRANTLDKRSFQVDGLEGSFAIHDPSDTTSTDNGTSVLVDATGRRYKIMTLQSLLLSPLG